MKHSAKFNLILCGSQDFRVSIWSTLQILKKPNKPLDLVKILYGHHSPIELLEVSDELALICSIDKEGVCLIHNMATFELLRSFNFKLDKGETIENLRVHKIGLIAVQTSGNRIFVYQ